MMMPCLCVVLVPACLFAASEGAKQPIVTTDLVKIRSVTYVTPFSYWRRLIRRS
jgi:hypothetical protein